MGTILPTSGSQRRMGLTASASSVPFSRSRTTDTAMAVIVVCMSNAPISPGTMKSIATGTNNARVSASMSRRRWMNSSARMP